jgi:WD40 repeat protein
MFLNLATGERTRMVNIQDEIAHYTVFSPNGQTAATAGKGRINLWNIATGKPVQTLYGHEGFINHLAFSADGKRLASAGSDAACRIWNLEAGRESVVFRGHGDVVNSVVFSPDGNLLASYGQEGVLKVWDAHRDRSLTVLPHANAVVNGAWSKDGKTISTIIAERLESWQEGARKPFKTVHLSRSYWYPVDWSPTFREYAYVTKQQQLAICDRETHRERKRLFEPGTKIPGLRYGPTGKQLFAVVEKELVILDGATYEPIATWPLPIEKLAEVASNRPGTAVALASDTQVIVLDTATGRTRFTLPLERPTPTMTAPVAFSPDGRMLLHGDDSTIFVRDAMTGSIVRQMRGHTVVVREIEFSPDGRRIATASDDYTVKLWDAKTGDEVLTLWGQGGIVWVAFSPDGLRLMSGGYDRTARIWEATPVTTMNRIGTPVE